MFDKIRVIFTIPELRNKIMITLMLLAVYRVGWQVPLPIVNQAKMSAYFTTTNQDLGNLLGQVAVFSASNLSQATIFGLGIMPYISASIIFQLLGSVWAPLEKLQKEGESGRKKINEYTRYATVVLCIIQSYFYVRFLVGSSPESSLVRAGLLNPDGSMPFFYYLVGVMTMTTGTVFLMWVGEQIDEYGIGNGISLLIMAGILSGMPGAAFQLLERFEMNLSAAMGPDKLIILSVLFVAVIVGVVLITQGQRRIPTQSAKHVRGRRVYGGGRQYLPLRVNQAGVMPIIFASSLLMFPQLIFSYLERSFNAPQWFQLISDSFNRGSSFVYNIMYIGLIYFFCYFWTAITFNPKDMADNLKDYGSFIPGYRPGKRTADYLERVMVRITYVGAGFLAVVAIIPTLISSALDIPPQVASFYGGTGLLIAVSVAFDLVQKIDSHLVMRNYRGLLERS